METVISQTRQDPAAGHAAPVLDIQNLSVDLPVASGTLHAVRSVNLRLAKGQTLCIVGESGSGKSMTSLALMSLLPAGARRSAARIGFLGEDLAQAGEAQMRALRGNRIAMVFQEPMTALNPSWTVGEQLIEGLLEHAPGTTRAQATARAVELLETCGVGEAARRLRQYPHQLSGGLRQRVMIAMALMTEPELLIADEPTTALDATIQAQILDLLKSLQRKLSLSIVLITHNFDVVRSIADQVAVMYAGEVVESGPADRVLSAPEHPYTQALLACTAIGPAPAAVPEPGPGTPLALEVRDLQARYPVSLGPLRGKATLQALRGVSLTVPEGRSLGIVGESGSGKSTLARMLLGLEAPSAGQVHLHGRPVQAYGRVERARLVQPVFQDPYGSLNPRRSIAATLRLPLDIHRIGTEAERDELVRRMMAQCGLPARLASALPSQLSGGQRQRVAIASALVMQPKLLVCDEPTSALDVSVQAQIVNLLNDLRAELGLSCVVISHDLGVIRRLSDRIAVMYLGAVVEERSAEALFERPAHPYTRMLLAASQPQALHAQAKALEGAKIQGEFPDPLNPPEGCAFHPRCPQATERCRAEAPRVQAVEGGRVACHFPLVPLAALGPIPGPGAAKAESQPVA